MAILERGSRLWLDLKHEGHRLSTPVAKAVAAKLAGDADWLRRLGIADPDQTTDRALVSTRIEPAIRLDWIAHLNGLAARPAVVSRSAAAKLVREWLAWRSARPRFKSKAHVAGRVERLTRWLDARDAEAADLLDACLWADLAREIRRGRVTSSVLNGRRTGGDAAVSNLLTVGRAVINWALAPAQGRLKGVTPLGRYGVELPNDPKRDITFTLTTPPISGTFKIQSVTVTDIGVDGPRTTIFPLRSVTASSERFTLERLLRRIRKVT